MNQRTASQPCKHEDGTEIFGTLERCCYCGEVVKEHPTSKNLLDRLRSAALTRGPLASVSVDKNDLLALVEWADKHGASTETSERHRGDDIDPKIAQQAWYHIQQLAVTDPSLWVRMAVQRVFQLMR